MANERQVSRSNEGNQAAIDALGAQVAALPSSVYAGYLPDASIVTVDLSQPGWSPNIVIQPPGTTALTVTNVSESTLNNELMFILKTSNNPITFPDGKQYQLIHGDKTNFTNNSSIGGVDEFYHSHFKHIGWKDSGGVQPTIKVRFDKVSDYAISELSLIWDDIANVPGAITDPADVSEWNTFFDLPTNGTAFTAAEVDGNTVKLSGGSDITVKPNLFAANTNILQIAENTGRLNSVTVVGALAFNGCTNLTTTILPGCTSIGGTGASIQLGGFTNCTSLSTVDFTSLDNISYAVFRGCTSLTNPSFPALRDIKQNAFQGAGLVNPSFPALTDIGTNAFYQCTNLTDEGVSNINPDVSIIGQGTFGFCTSLVNPSFPGVIETVNSCFNGCTGLVNPSFPVLEIIGQSTFYACTSLTKSSWPLVRLIGVWGFRNSGLINGSFPVCTSVGNFAFESMPVETLSFPSCIDMGGTTGNDSVFLNDTSLASLTVNSAIQFDVDVTQAATLYDTSIFVV